jgi:hypothetical protein
MVCPQCGSENAEGSRFCGRCGSSLTGGASQSQPGGNPGQPYPPANQPQYQQPYPQQGPPYQYGGQQYQQQPYPHPGYAGTPPYQQFSPEQRGYYPGQPGPCAARPHIPSHLALAIISVFTFWPTAIAAIIFATQVDNKLQMGDIYGAQNSSRNAKIWGWIGIGLGVGIWVVFIILWLTVWAGVFAATSFSNGIVY